MQIILYNSIMEEKKIQKLYQHMIEVVEFFQQTDNDKKLLAEHQIQFDYKLFPLFIAITRLEPTTIKVLAAYMGRSHSTLSRQVDRLENEGFIHTAASSEDARAREIRTSELGIRLAQEIQQARVSAINRAFAHISEERQEQLLADLELLTTLLQHYQED